MRPYKSLAVLLLLSNLSKILYFLRTSITLIVAVLSFSPSKLALYFLSYLINAVYLLKSSIVVFSISIT